MQVINNNNYLPNLQIVNLVKINNVKYNYSILNHNN
jgi:hypothetical protein